MQRTFVCLQFKIILNTSLHNNAKNILKNLYDVNDGADRFSIVWTV